MTDSDPLRRRPNPEIQEMLRVIRTSADEMLAETDYTRRRGLARILIAHLEALVDEPELVPGPVQEGPGSGDRFRLEASEFESGKVPFLDEEPFEHPGESEGSFFFFAGGKLSPLYRGPALDPYQFPNPLYRFGPWAYSLEKRFSTEQETKSRVPGSVVDALGAKKRAPGSDATPEYFVLCDPKGVDEVEPPQSLLVSTHASLPRAIGAARKLSAKLGIRALVAKVSIRFCTR
jgi:hypothetical protein